MRKMNLSSRLVVIYLVLTLAIPPGQLFAASSVVAPGSGNTTVTTAANGVEVVNINTANDAGLSHNKFTDYNVAVNGQVLNNANGSATQIITVQSQLAGVISANNNLSVPARSILLEVVAPNRSRLEGFTEVLGGRANVIVANPFGLTCAGCGFINTDRASLITGTPNINANGTLGSFNVNGGDILITGSGVNASAQQMLDLVSRSVKIDGQVNAPDLAIATGANTWDYESRTVTGAATADGAAPEYAIDSTAVGGIYAGRISLIATEAGVGVRMLGEAASTASDFAINSAGRIEIASRVSSAGNLNVTSTAEGAEAIKLTDASLSTAGSLNLTAVHGGAAISGGALVAQSNLGISAGSLSDNSTATALPENNKRYAAGNVEIATSGATTMNGVSYSTGGTLNLTTTATGSEAIKLTDTALSAATNLTLAAANGGIVLAGGGLLAKAALGISAQSLNDSATATALVDNNGRHAGGNLSVSTTGGQLAMHGVSYDAVGTLALNSTASGAEAIKLTDAALAAKGNLNISAANGGAAIAGGLLMTQADLGIAVQSLNDSLTESALTDNNKRTADGGVTIATNGAATMSGVSYGSVGEFKLTSTAAGASAIILNDTSIKTTGMMSNLTLSAVNGETALAGGALVAGADLGISAWRLSDSSTVTGLADNNKRYADGAVNLAISDAATVDGGLYVAGDSLAGIFGSLAVGASGAAFSSASTLGLTATTGDLGLGGSAIHTSSYLNLTSDTGKITVASGADQGIQTTSGVLSVIAQTGLENAGTMSADTGGAQISVNGTITNSGTINAGSYLTIGDKSGGNAVDIALGSNGKLVGDNVTIKGTTLALASGANIGGSSLDIAVNDLTLAAASAKIIAAKTASSTGTPTILVANSFSNSGTIQSAGDLTIGARSLTNNSTGTFSAADNLQLFAINTVTGAITGDITNNGKLYAGKELSALKMNNFTNGANPEAKVQSGDKIYLTSTASITNNGEMVGSYVNFVAPTVSLGSNSVLASSGAMDIQADSLTTADATAKILAVTSGVGTAAINLTTAFTNNGLLHSGGDLRLTAPSITNTATGTLAALQALYLDPVAPATLVGIVNAGTIYGGSMLYLIKVEAFTNSGTVSSGGAITLNTTDTITNNGVFLGNSVDIDAPQLVLGSGSQLGSTGNLDIHATAATNGLTLADGTAEVLAASSGTGTATITVDSAFTNNGLLYSGGNLTFAASSITNGATGAFGANNTLTLDAKGGAIYNAGSLYAGSKLDATVGSSFVGALPTAANTSLFTNAAGATIKSDGNIALTATEFVNNSDKFLGGSVDIIASKVTLGSGSRLGSTGNMNIRSTSATNGLTLADSTAKIIAASSGTGTSTITAASAIHNPGLIHSGGNLTVTAPSIVNDSTGAFSALDTLSLDGQSGDVLNSGSLYAGNQLTATAGGNITNVGTLAARVGEINSGGNISLTANNFTNNSYINAANNITINAAVFTNSVSGGDTRSWYESGRANVSNLSTWAGDSMIYAVGGCPNTPTADHCQRFWRNDLVTLSQRYLNDIAPGFKPQIIGATGTVTIQGFDTAGNVGAIISGNNVTLAGNPAATFTNKDLTLNTSNYIDAYDRLYIFTPAQWADGYHPNDYAFYAGYGSYIDRTVQATAAPNPPVVLTPIAGKEFSSVIHADSTFTAGGFALVNQGSTGAAPAGGAPGLGVAPTVATPTAGAITDGGAPAAGTAPAVTAPAVGTVTFGGLTLTLPTNPNGYYVINSDPNSRYLVVINPLYAPTSQPRPVVLGSRAAFRVETNVLYSSEYLQTLIKYTADKTQKYLGDAAYEAYLVRQQLLSLTNGDLLKGYANQAAQMKGLLEQAAAQSSGLGLTYGQPLSAAQQAGLTGDMIWMVETTVRGQKVLAPVVYLSKATKDEIETGAVIYAGKASMNLASLTNTGGTIKADQLSVTTSGDLKNSSGTIMGGNVNLASTGGSIVNDTLGYSSGDDTSMLTMVGKTGGIIATNDLTVDAAVDITNKGAKMAAGGDASLSAGGNVNFDTVENKTTTTSRITDGVKTVKTTEQIKSELAAGGALTIKSKNDLTLAGTNVTAGKSASLDAGGNVNILARNDTKEESTQTAKEGWGLAGGIYGKENSDTNHYVSTNNASTITVGKGGSGALDITAGKTVTVKGSELAAGDMSFTAEEVKVLAGENIDRTTTKTEKTSWFSISKGSDAVTSTDSAAKTGSENTSSTGSAKSAVAASASASAEVSKDLGGLDFKKTITNETTDETKTSVGSKLSAGGNIKMKTKKDITVQGSDVKAGGNVDLTAENVNILAAENSHISTSKSETSKVGLYLKSTNSAGANADAKAGAAAGVAGAGASAGVSADANATAKTSNSLDFVRTNKTDTENKDTTHTGSTISSGGNLKINSNNALTVQGSDLSGEKGVDLQAKEMAFQAAEDTTYSKTASSSTSVGLYVDGTAKANASGKVGASANISAEAGGKASANAAAELSIGVQVDSKSKTNIDGTSTARTSSIKSGSGSISRTASGTITDVGTNIEAAGDFSQSATTIDMQAAKNTSYSSETTANNNVKVGVYAKAEAGASLDAKAATGTLKGAVSDRNAQVTPDVTAKVGAGISVNVNNDNSKSDSASSTAVVSTIKAGGKVSSTSSGKTTLEGTQISSGGKAEITADSLEFKAARDTTSSSSTSNKTGVSAKIGVSRGTGSGIDASLDVAVGDKNSRSDSSTAVTGSINSGGDLVINTRKDATFEGTNLASGGDASVKSSEGNLKFNAAKNTASSSSNGVDVGVNASLARPTGKSRTDSTTSAGAAVDHKNASSSSSEAVVGSITSKGKLDLSAKNNATFEGTKIESTGDTNISAGGDVEMKAARNTSTSQSFGMNVGVKGSGEKDVKSNGTTTNSKYGQLDGGASTSKADSSTAEVGSVKSGGKLNISSGKDSKFEGTVLAANNKVVVDAGGKVDFTAAKSTDTSSGFGLAVTLAGQKTTKAPTAPGKGATAPASDAKTTGNDKKADSPAPAAKDKSADRSTPNYVDTANMLKDASSGSVGAALAKGTGVPLANTDTIDRTTAGAGVKLKYSDNNKETYQGASISGNSGIEIKARGGDVNLESTKLKGGGDMTISAAGKVNETTVTNKDFGINVDVAVPVITLKDKATTTPASKPIKSDLVPAKPAAKDKDAFDKAQKKADEAIEKKSLLDTNVLRTGDLKPRITAPAAVSDPNVKTKSLYTNDSKTVDGSMESTGRIIIKENAKFPEAK